MIVKADISHLDAAWRIIDRCRASLRERGIFQWDDVYPTREDVEADIGAGRLYALTTGEHPQAIVTMDSIQEPEYATLSWMSPEPALVVHRLCVDPSAQGRGLGGQLMDYVEKHASRHRFASIRLDAYSGNPQALSLYRRRGYREVGQVLFPRRTLPFCCFELNVGSGPV